jgi:acyl-CoA thioester hydrolase
MYTTTVTAGWADIDLNGHMRNTCYLEKSVDVRMMYFAASGFEPGEFARLGLGPAVMTDEIRYFREVGLLETLRATLALAGLAPDGSRLRLRNEFHRGDGQLAARVDSVLGWLDHGTRRLVTPPAVLLDVVRRLGQTADFAVLPSSVRT